MSDKSAGLLNEYCTDDMTVINKYNNICICIKYFIECLLGLEGIWHVDEKGIKEFICEMMFKHKCSEFSIIIECNKILIMLINILLCLISIYIPNL